MKAQKILIGIVILAVPIFLFFVHGSRDDQTHQRPEAGEANFPWQIQVRPDGLSRVFGITLGQTTLHTVQTRLRDGGEISMFLSPEKQATVEVYFKKAVFSGIRGKLVLLLEPEEVFVTAMHDRGTRIKAASGGGRKIELHPEDEMQLRHAPIGAITYEPFTDLDEDVLRQRFGEPSQRLTEPENPAVVHWLYPDMGLDIALNSRGREVFQYVAPREFARLLEGL